ncbi:MAG: methyltransferase domain-containing protein [Flavobacteriaceae bacterium]
MQFNAEFWNTKYQTNDTRWDIGKISTPLQQYIDQLTDKDVYILIPGGGNSYEAEYLHKQGFKNVYVVDLSEHPLHNIKQRVPDFQTAHLIQADFFTIHLSHPKLTFNLIIEQTFFCAIHPKLRVDYVKQTHRLLKPEGKLVGLLFNDALNTDKPPFGGHRDEYLSLFQPLYSCDIFEDCYNSILERANRELFIKLTKK